MDTLALRFLVLIVCGRLSEVPFCCGNLRHPCSLLGGCLNCGPCCTARHCCLKAGEGRRGERTGRIPRAGMILGVEVVEEQPPTLGRQGKKIKRKMGRESKRYRQGGESWKESCASGATKPGGGRTESWEANMDPSPQPLINTDLHTAHILHTFKRIIASKSNCELRPVLPTI